MIGWVQVLQNETSSLGIRIARLSWVENRNEMYYKFQSIFIFCFAILRLVCKPSSDCVPDFQRKYMAVQQIILIYPLFGQFIFFRLTFKKS